MTTKLGITTISGAQTHTRTIYDENLIGRLYDVEGQFKSFPALGNTLGLSIQQNTIIPEGRTPIIHLNAVKTPGSYTTDNALNSTYTTMWTDILTKCSPKNPYVRCHLEFNALDGGHYIGTNTQFIAWWRYMHGLYATALAGYGGSNSVIWCWAPTAAFTNTTGTSYAPPWYPGDDVVDRICVDGYNRGTTNATFTQPSAIFSDWVTWATTNSRGGNPSSTPGVTNGAKTLGITESGTVENAQDLSPGSSKATWFYNMGQFLIANPSIEFWMYDDTIGTAAPTSLHIDTTAASLTEYIAVVNASPFSSPAGPPPLPSKTYNITDVGLLSELS